MSTPKNYIKISIDEKNDRLVFFSFFLNHIPNVFSEETTSLQMKIVPEIE